MAAVKSLHAHRFGVVIFTFSGPFGLKDLQNFEGRVALNPGLGGVRDVVSVVIFYEQTQYQSGLCLF